MSGKIVDNQNRSSGLIKAEAAGANITWDTTEKTSDFNAEAGVGYLVDTSSGAVSATLPASPTGGDAIAFKDYTATFGSNNLTILRNGEKIQGNAGDSKIKTNRASVVLVYVDDTEGWVYVEEANVGARGNQFVLATGGTVTTSGDFRIHTFNSSGTFSVTCAGGTNSKVDYLVVAGGGGGSAGAAASRGGGAGGAGGFRTTFPSPSCNAGSFSVTAQDYPITVGAGGPANPGCATGRTGSNSVFATITSAGGGAGGSSYMNSPCVPGNLNGGSGGGGGGSNACALVGSGGSGNTPPVSPPQGNNGGNGGAQNGNTRGGGGGGGGGISGAGSNGGDAGPPGATVSGGSGGSGAANSITASPVTYAAGGTGGGNHSGSDGSAGTTNRGNGGGGGGGGPCIPATTGDGAAGGSGVVVIRYKFQ